MSPSLKTPAVSIGILLALACGSRVSTQDPVIKIAGPGQIVRAMLSHRRGLAHTSDGRLWTLVWFHDGKGATADLSRHLLLMTSPDGGKTWKQVADTRTTGDSYGSLFTDPDGKTLHVVWNAWNGKKNPTRPGAFLSSVYYAAFDTVKSSWKGTADTVIAAAKNDREQYYDPDVAVTPLGTVYVSFGNRYVSPPNLVGTPGSWNGHLVWNKGQGWGKPHRINLATYGVRVDLHPEGETLRIAYRSNPGLYGIRIRSFDAVKGIFGPEIPIPAPPGAKLLVHGNQNALAVAGDGGIYVIYARNANEANPKVSQIRAAYMAPGATKFSADLLLATDTFGMGGNTTFYSFSLGVDGAGRVYALYSLRSEKHRNLYLNYLIGGKMLPRIKFRSGTRNDQFAMVLGHRYEQGRHGLLAVYTDRSQIGPLTGGRAMLLGGPSGSAVLHGRACKGSLALAPSLRASSAPALGSPLKLSLGAHPSKAPGILFLGISDKFLGALPLPLPLKTLGMGGCVLTQDIVVPLIYQADLKGGASLSLPFPNDPKLAGIPLFFQAFVLAKGANPAGAVLSNGLAAVAR